MFKTFGSTSEVFVNQDEGMFVALPVTLDADALSLETEVRNGRTYVLAGSVVKEVVVDELEVSTTYIKGITAEEYDITYGPVNGRVVLEGYAWRDKLTDDALAAAPLLPRIVLIPTLVEEQ